MGDTVHHYYFRKKDTFIQENFQASAFAHDSFSELNPSPAGRLRNSLVMAMNQARYCPRLIVIIVENDLTKSLRFDEEIEITEKLLKRTYTNLTKWLVREYTRLKEAFLEKLPKKSKKNEDYPYFLWILPTQHKNFADNAKRELFASCLTHAATNKENNFVLPLKQVWDQWDNSLFRSYDNRHSESGYTMYWEAVDRTIRFCDASIDRKRMKRMEKQIYAQRNTTRGNMTWTRGARRFGFHSHGNFSTRINNQTEDF